MAFKNRPDRSGDRGRGVFALRPALVALAALAFCAGAQAQTAAPAKDAKAPAAQPAKPASRPAAPTPAAAQPPKPAARTTPPADLSPDDIAVRAGRGFIGTPIHSLDEDKQLLALFDGLRVADVTDGMDAVGLPGVGLMDPEVHPLWKDAKDYSHRFIGIAVTARYVPTQQPQAGKRTVEDYDRWSGEWYNKVSPEPFVDVLRPGSALVIEDASRADVGSIGSNNIMAWKLRGAVGVVTDATARDTDEIMTERMPLYFRHPGRGIRPGRNEIESVNRPIVCGGVLVVPGDVVVADGDGVVVVPRAVASDVARYAKKILEGDKAGRRGLYEKLGLPKDKSVE